MTLKPPLPKEHGSWAMLIVPLLLGLVIAPVWHGQALLLLLAALGFFLVRYPLAVLVKTRKRATADKALLWRWTAIYGGLTVLSGGWLVFVQGLGWLAVMGLFGGLLLLFHLWLVSRRQEMSLGGELVGIVGLALGAPMAYYAASGYLDQVAAVLWLINALYFGGTVFYIKLKVRQQPRLPAPERVGERLVKAKACLAYQTVALTLLLALATLQWAPLLTPLAFVPVTIKMVYGAWQWQDKKSLSLVRLGIAEIIHAVAFAGLVVLIFR
ncbi:MAG: YwiC-like family protein [Anaerolineales bacterium]|nr:YwiC-like family protein [Anaerolineales bacterium]